MLISAKEFKKLRHSVQSDQHTCPLVDAVNGGMAISTARERVLLLSD